MATKGIENSPISTTSLLTDASSSENANVCTHKPYIAARSLANILFMEVSSFVFT